MLCTIGDVGDGPGCGAVSTSGIEDRNGVGVGVDVAVGVGDRVADGDSAGNGVSVGLGDGDGDGSGDGDGVGEGRSTIGSSVGCASAAGVDCLLGVGAGVRVDPGSDQSPTFSPLTKVVCNLV